MLKQLKLHIHVLLIIAVLVVAAPVLFAFIVSTQSVVEVFSYPPKLTPGAPRFTLTEESFTELQAVDIPDAVVDALRELKGKEHTGEERFLKALNKVLGAEQAAQYADRIIEHTHGSRWSNYPASWKFVNLGRMMFNSAFLAFAVTLGKLIISLMAAFAFSHFEFRGKDFFFFLILITLMLPIPVRIVPLFELFAKMGKINEHLGVDTYFSLIVPFIASATGTFLFRQHFMTIPAELTDAARMDGCGPLRFLFQVLIPLSKNTIGALVVIEFVYIWNQYLWPLIVTNSEEMRVVQIGIKMLTATEALQNWGVIMAGVLLAMIPPLIVFFLMQESFMRGFAFMREK